MKFWILTPLVWAVTSCQLAQEKDTNTIAKIGSEVIEKAEIDALIQPEMYESLFNTYYARNAMLEEAIAQKLLLREAKKLGVGVDSLRSMISSKKMDSTSRAQFVEENFLGNGLVDPDRIGRKVPLESERGQQLLEQAMKRSILQTYIERLRGESNVQVFLEPPLPPPIDLSEIKYHSLSGKGKKNTIWLFADYSCSHCIEFYPVFDHLVRLYGEQIEFRYTTLTDDVSEMALLGEFAGDRTMMKQVNSLIFSGIGRGSINPGEILESAGLSMHAFRKYENNPASIKGIKENNLKLKRLGKFQATPTVIINNRVYYGDLSFNELNEFIKKYCLGSELL